MRYEILSDNSVTSDDGENATQYLFLEVPYKNGKAIEEGDLDHYCQEQFERRVSSPYDCSGQWFTSGITAKIVDDNDWDNKLTVAVVINWGCDV